MKLLYFDGKFNMPLLCEELVAAFPNWMIVLSGILKFLGKVVKTETGVRITVPFENDVPAVEALVAVHNWKAKSKNEVDQENRKKDRIDGIAKLKSQGLTDAQITALFGRD